MKKGEITNKFPFPVRGLDISVAQEDLQPQFSPDLMNVRPYDFKDRSAGGSRPPIRRLIPDGTAGNPTARSVAQGGTLAEEPVQAMCELYGVEFTGLNDTETTTKAITVVYVVGGYLYRLDWDIEADTRSTTQIGQVCGPTAGVTLAQDGPIVFVMCDDVVPAYTDSATQTTFHKYFNALDNTLNDWTADTHALLDADSPDYPGVPLVDPNEAFSVDGNGDDARTLVPNNDYKGYFPTTNTKLCVKWGRRIVLAGFKGDEQNIICSRKGDSFDFDWRPIMNDKYLEENIQIEAANADYTTQVAAYNAKLAAAIGPEPGTQPVFAYTLQAYDGDNIPIAAPNATGPSSNERTARSVCRSNLSSYKAATRSSNGSYTGVANWQIPDDLMRSATLESKDVNEYLRDTYPVRYEETQDETELADMAWSARHSDVGLVPDEIVNLIPYDENILIIVCKSSIWELNGGADLSNARLRPVTETIGGTDGDSWIIDPDRNIFLVGSDKGIYKLVLQQGAQRIDLPIEFLTNKFDRSEGRWTLLHDDAEGGIYFHGWDNSNYINLFYSLRTGGWFVDDYAGDPLMSRVQCGVSLNPRDGDARDNSRYAVWGSRDGELYFVDSSYTGEYRDEITYSSLPRTARIDSSVLLGPMRDPEGSDLLLKMLSFEMEDDSSVVVWEGYAADTASQASMGSPLISGMINYERLRVERQRMSGSNAYIKILSHPSHEGPWALDHFSGTAELRSPLRRRT